jgi:Fe-S-cluster containining protein
MSRKKHKIKPRCFRCGKCCREHGFGLTVTPGDTRRWKKQGRADILRYAWIPRGVGGYGDIWIDPETGEDLDYCPFLQKVSLGKYICSIYETRPKICREFWCEYAYGVGRRGQTFRGMAGWTERARQLGYGQAKAST